MYINCHTHVFNARSVFNTYTLEILLNRLSDVRLDPVVKTVLTEQLQKAITQAGEYIDEQFFYREIVTKLYGNGRFQELLHELSSGEKKRIGIVGLDVLGEAATDKLINMLAGVSDRMLYGNLDKDAATANALDFFAFLSIIFQPSIRAVADILMRQLPGKTDGVIALLMDITRDGNDQGQYARQIDETSQVVLAYPGRFFPFVAVNTNRPDHLQVMRRALTGQGYVGIKLYPSLGYHIDSPAMYRVYGECEADGIPIIMHCNKGGFRYSSEYSNFSSPRKWRAILDAFPNLKICFGHFGGDRFMAGLPEDPSAPDQAPWTPLILDLMAFFPGVFADLSFHTAAMDRQVEVTDDGNNGKTVAVEENYFAGLRTYLSHPVYRERILWGTDYFLVRQRLQEKSQWKYFRDRMTREEFIQIAEANPRTFLNLPATDALIKEDDYVAPANLVHYMEFIIRNHDRVEQAKAPSWLDNLIKRQYGNTVQFHGTPLGSSWSPNNLVHRTLFRALATSNQFLGEPDFTAAGLRKLGELRYAREISYTSSAKIRRQKWEHQANMLIEVFSKRAFQPAKRNGKELKKPTLRRELVKTLQVETKTVADLGAVLDALYEAVMEGGSE